MHDQGSRGGRDRPRGHRSRECRPGAAARHGGCAPGRRTRSGCVIRPGNSPADRRLRRVSARRAAVPRPAPGKPGRERVARGRRRYPDPGQPAQQPPGDRHGCQRPDRLLSQAGRLRHGRGCGQARGGAAAEAAAWPTPPALTWPRWPSGGRRTWPPASAGMTTRGCLTYWNGSVVYRWQQMFGGWSSAFPAQARRSWGRCSCACAGTSRTWRRTWCCPREPGAPWNWRWARTRRRSRP